MYFYCSYAFCKSLFTFHSFLISLIAIMFYISYFHNNISHSLNYFKISFTFTLFITIIIYSIMIVFIMVSYSLTSISLLLDVPFTNGVYTHGFSFDQWNNRAFYSLKSSGIIADDSIMINDSFTSSFHVIQEYNLWLFIWLECLFVSKRIHNKML